MKILITGAGGFVGKNLLARLLNLNYELLCLARDENEAMLI